MKPLVRLSVNLVLLMRSSRIGTSRSSLTKKSGKTRDELDEVISFWNQVRRFSLFLSTGIASCILAVGMLVFFANVISEIIGFLAMFLLVAF